MKKCAKCGKENIDEAVYCANCGARLEFDSKKPNSSNNSSTPTPALSTLKKHMADDSSFSSYKNNSNASSNTSSDISSSSKNNSNSIPGISQKYDKEQKFKICCCYVPVIIFIVFLGASFIYHDFAESFPTGYEDDFNYLDLDGDGRLSFDEITLVDWNLSDSLLSEYFNEADTNNNGFLKGHEFDIFGDNVKDYHRHSEDSSSSSDEYKYSSSSISSGSSSHGRDYNTGNSKATNSLNNQEFDRSGGYVLTCPYCGSEAVYETGGHYRCAECGRNIYNPDDLELGYWEGYMELISPALLLVT